MKTMARRTRLTRSAVLISRALSPRVEYTGVSRSLPLLLYEEMREWL
jgi:hypothetical protein